MLHLVVFYAYMSDFANIPRRRYTPAEFAEASNIHVDHVRKMCRGAKDVRSKNRYKLPSGWRAEKNMTGGWEICSDEAILPAQAFGLPLHKLIELITQLFELGGSSVSNSVEVLKIVRLEQLRQMLAPYVREEDPRHLLEALIKIEKQWLKMLSDQELGEIFINRWQKDLHLRSLSDLAQSIELSSSISDRMRWGQPLRNPVGLFDRLREAYQAAATTAAGDSREITIKFECDGSWSCDSVDYNFEHVFGRLQAEGALDVPPGVAINAIEGLYYVAWKADLNRKISKQPSALEHFISIHPKRDEFHKRCLYCGKPLGDRRKQTKHCNDYHRISYSKWMGRLKPLWKIAEERGGNSMLEGRLLDRLRSVAKTLKTKALA